MPETDTLGGFREWWNSLPEPERTAFVDFAFTDCQSLNVWLEAMGKDGTVEDVSKRIRTFREDIAPILLEGGYIAAYLYGQLGLTLKYLEKFDDDAPMEEIPDEFEADIRGWCLDLAEMLKD